MKAFVVASLMALFCVAWLTGPLTAQTPKEPVTLKGHTEGVTRLAWSGDGKLLASGSYDKTVRVWDATGKQKANLPQEHWASVVALSHDGKTGVTGGENVVVWDVIAAKRKHILISPEGGFLPHNFAFHSDSELVATVSESSVALWEATTGKKLFKLDTYTGSVVAISGDGKLVATAGIDDTVIIRDGRTGKEKAALKGHTGSVSWIRFSTDGKHVLSAGFSGSEAIVWDLATGEKRSVTKNAETVSDDGKWAVVPKYTAPSKLDGIVLRNTTTGEEKPALKGHKGKLKELQFSPDGRFLATYAEDPTVRVWEVESGRELVNDPGESRLFMSVAFSPDSKTVAIGHEDGTIRLWHLPESKKNEK